MEKNQINIFFIYFILFYFILFIFFFFNFIYLFIYLFIFYISSQNIDCGTRWNRLSEAVLMSTNNLCFLAKQEE